MRALGALYKDADKHRLKGILQKQEMCLILLTKMKEGSKLAQCSGVSTIKLGSPCQAKV